MGFNGAKNCLALFLAVLPTFCRGFWPNKCLGEDGQYYEYGTQMPSRDRCVFNCICRGFDEIECSNIVDCPFPRCGKSIVIEGECCPLCVGCEHNGDPMPSDNPCETNCYCADDGLPACARVDCPQAPCENSIYVAGECCPRCGCKQNGQFYSIGEAMPSDTPCGFDCTCGENGQIQCKMVTCAPLNCEISFVPMGRCCPVCGCIYRDIFFEIGDIVRNVRCKPLVCQSNGIIKAEPVECPNLRLECINPVIPIGKCCPECLNGPWI